MATPVKIGRPIKSIVVTGSTRGIGLGLATAFLDRGCSVTINGRTARSVRVGLQQLKSHTDPNRLHGAHGDVTSLVDMVELWDSAMNRFGRVDVWINNAGIAHEMSMVWDLSPEVVKNVVNVNVMGVLYGSRVAVRGMLAQGGGQLFNMEGFGSNGRVRAGLSVYGATKAAVTYLTKALVEETRDTPVLVGTLSPGIVITDLLLDPLKDNPEAMERGRRAFNILGDRVETVTPYLADRVLSNNKTGARIEWLTTSKVIGRFLVSPFRKRELV